MNDLIPREQMLPSTAVVKFEDTGVVLDGTPTKGELLGAWRRVQYVSQRSPWYVGDLLNLLEERFDDGEEMQYVNETLGIQTIRNYKSCCAQLPVEIRRPPEELSYTAHSRFAPLPTIELRAWWIGLAVERSWNSEDCRKAYGAMQPYLACVEPEDCHPGMIDEEAVFALVETEPLSFDSEGFDTPAGETLLPDPGMAPDAWDVTMTVHELQVAQRVLRRAEESFEFDDQPWMKGAMYNLEQEVTLALGEANRDIEEHKRKVDDYLEQQSTLT